MGKGTRNRQRNQQAAAEDRYNHPEKYQKKGNKKARKGGLPAWATILSFVLIAVILLGSVSLILIYENGVVLRTKKALESDHYKITGTMMQYYYYYQYQQTYTQYYEMALSYLGSADYISYFGWTLKSNFAHDDELNNACKLGTALKDDKGKDMKDKNGNTLYDSVAINLRGGTIYTWWDYFMDAAIKQAEDVLIFCEAAYLKGYKTVESLNPEAKKDINEAIKSIKKAASDAGYSMSGYLTQLYGNGVTETDVRKALELSTIASEYKALVNKQIAEKITADDVNKGYADNKYSYHYADALSIAINLNYDEILEKYVDALGEDYKDAEYNEAVKKADREYSVRLAHLKEIAPKFAEAKENEALYRDLVSEIYAYMYAFSTHSEKTDGELVVETVVKDALAFLKTMTDETKVEEKDPLANRVASQVRDELDLLMFEDMKYENDALGHWAFKAVGQKAGNVLVTVTDIDGKETVFAYPELEYVDLEKDEDEKDEDEKDDDTTAEDDKKEEEDDKKEDDKDSGKVKSEYEGQKYEFCAYYMVKPGARDEYKSLELGFIMIPVEKHDHKEGEEVDHDHIDAEKVSKEYLEELLKKENLTPDDFKQFAEDKGVAQYNVIEEYLKGDLGYDEIDEWVFAEGSRVGKGDVVEIYGENTTGDPLYYVIVYGFSEGNEAWYTAVKKDLVSEEYNSWIATETTEGGKKITTNKSLLKDIAN